MELPQLNRDALPPPGSCCSRWMETYRDFYTFYLAARQAGLSEETSILAADRELLKKGQGTFNESMSKFAQLEMEIKDLKEKVEAASFQGTKSKYKYFRIVEIKNLQRIS